MIDMITFFDAIRNEANHEGKVNKYETNANQTFGTGMHNAIYKFAKHTSLLDYVFWVSITTNQGNNALVFGLGQAICYSDFV